MGNYKWNKNDSDTSLPYVVVLMVARNKDNKDVPNFKERRRAFLHTKDMSYINNRFTEFIRRGVPGEMDRLYISVNARDISKVQRAMLHELIDKKNFNPDYIESWVAGIAARKENAAEDKWMFDVDITDESEFFLFEKDLKEYVTDALISKTPNGYAVITNKHFDTRELLAKWKGKATLKRDDLLCWDWYKGEID